MMDLGPENSLPEHFSQILTLSSVFCDPIGVSGYSRITYLGEQDQV